MYQPILKHQAHQPKSKPTQRNTIKHPLRRPNF